MMPAQGVTRRLWAVERDQVRDHLLRLDPEDRRLRFAGQVSDSGVAAYTDRLDWTRAVLVGHLIDGELRGLGELKPLAAGWPRAAEAAVSVERGWQNRGVGTDLLRRLIVIARNRLIRRLSMICVPANQKIVRIARKLGATLDVRQGEVDARLTMAWPNQLTVLLELIDEGRAMLSPPSVEGPITAGASSAS